MHAAPSIWRIGSMLIALSLLGWSYPAASVTNAASSAAPINPVSIAPSDQLYWIQLTPAQRHALAPLMAQWESLDGADQRKWMAFADRYQKMTPVEQRSAQARMSEWMQLSPEQRNVARDSYARTKALSPEKRAQLLERYKALPEEKKKQLTEQGKGPKKLILHKATSEAVPTHAQIREGAKLNSALPNSAHSPARNPAASKP